MKLYFMTDVTNCSIIGKADQPVMTDYFRSDAHLVNENKNSKLINIDYCV